MKTLILLILSLLLSLGEISCTKECDDKHTLDNYTLDLNNEIALQKTLSTQVSLILGINQHKVDSLSSLISVSLTKEQYIQQKIDALKKNSRCL